MRKPNVQSPLDQLAEDQQHELWELLRTTKYEDAVDEVRARYGVRSSVSALQGPAMTNGRSLSLGKCNGSSSNSKLLSIMICCVMRVVVMLMMGGTWPYHCSASTR